MTDGGDSDRHHPTPLSKASAAAGAQGRFQKLENTHRLLVELTKVVPAVLLHVLPVLCSELDRTAPTLRLAAATVLGQLFALPVLISSGMLGSMKQ
jgi:hypothetical protein